MKRPKAPYEKTELYIVCFDSADVIATSSPYSEEGDTGDWTPKHG